jgi:hypothetical protein
MHVLDPHAKTLTFSIPACRRSRSTTSRTSRSSGKDRGWNRTEGETVDLSITGPVGTVTEYALDGSTAETRAGASFQVRLEAGIPRVFLISLR